MQPLRRAPSGLVLSHGSDGRREDAVIAAFALKHARLHGMERVVYVIPFTSIIDQNAKVFRDALAELGDNVVLEHHSNLDPDSEHVTQTTRLASENWDARLIVTTNVQFFESVHAKETSPLRSRTRTRTRPLTHHASRITRHRRHSLSAFQNLSFSAF